MSTPEGGRNPVEELAEDFLARYRRGERPSLSEYVRRHPELAAEIRDVFPALVMMEEAGPQSAPGTGDRPGSGAVPFGERLGEYRILREVGRGGMGVVYEAEQESLGRHVALKVLPAHAAASPIYLQRFRREARSAARLHHTNIVPVYDVGDFQGVHYYAMQFIQGQGLDEVLHELRRLRGMHADAGKATREAFAPASGLTDPNRTAALVRGLLTEEFAAGAAGPSDAWPPADEEKRPAAAPPSLSGTHSDLSGQSDFHYYRGVARIGLQVAEALAYAHAQKVLHRDIKPANLLLDLQGTVWVTDFGLAKEEGDDLTHTGDLVGTLRYMAPERFQGVSDARSDVYSLGLTLYELLTLRPAFTETDRGWLIRRVTQEGPPRPRKVAPRLPRDLETILLKATAREPRLRYPGAVELAEDLRLFLADRPIRARRTAVWEYAWRWCRRNPGMAGLTALVGLLLILVGIGVPVAALLRGERDRALAAEAEARTAEGEARAAQQRAQKAEGEVAFRSHLARAAVYRHSEQVGQSFKGMAEVQKALRLVRDLDLGPATLLEARNEAIACLCLPDLEVAREWDGFPPGSSRLAFDPTFRLYAVADRPGAVVVRRVRDSRVLYHLPAAGIVDREGLQFSPDGRFLHRFCENGLSRLWRLDADRAVVVLSGGHRRVAFRPDGRQFAAGYPDGFVRLLDSQSGKELRRFATGLRGEFILSWNPKGPQLLLGWKADWRLLDLETGKVRTLAPPVPRKGAVWAMAWHPEGRIVAVTDQARRAIYLWDTIGNRLVSPPLRTRNTGISVCFNHRGDRLLSNEWGEVWRLWDTRTGRQLLMMPGGSNFPMQFSPDDSLVAAGVTPPKLRLFRFRAGALRTLIAPSVAKGEEGYGFRPTGNDPYQLDRTGRLLPVAIDENQIALVDVRRGEVAARLPGEDCAGFSTDGSLWTGGREPGGAEWLYRWPCVLDAGAGRQRFGPPERVYPKAYAGKTPDGTILAFPDSNRGTLVYDRDRQRSWRLGPQEDVRNSAISANRRWLATGSHWLHSGGGARVWDLHARPPRQVKEFPVGRLCGLQFSSDGTWLLTLGGGPRLWKVGTWEEGPALAGVEHNSWGAFSADGKLLALGHEPGVIRLVVPASGQEVARLTAPVKSRLVPRAFTPDAALLIALGIDTGTLHIFDLRAIRTQLAGLGLDWDPPSIPPAPAGDIAPRQLEVDTGDLGMTAPQRRDYWRRHVALCSLRLAFNAWDVPAMLQRGTAHLRLGVYAKALPDFAQALSLIPPGNEESFAPGRFPELGRDLNNCAWQWVVDPARNAADRRARLIAERAVQMAPGQWSYRNTLGAVCYRLGDYPAARRHLEQSLHDSQGAAAAFDLFFLAMCHQRLKDPARARSCYDRAVRWVGNRQGSLASWAKELQGLREEAAAVLHISSK